jgi:hypothetical protein
LLDKADVGTGKSRRSQRLQKLRTNQRIKGAFGALLNLPTDLVNLPADLAERD